MPHSFCPACLQPGSGLSICANCGWNKTSSTTDPQYLAPGSTLNPPYQVARMLGHGGFGITYLGWDANLQIKVAIKEYLPREWAHRDAKAGQVVANSSDAQVHFQTGLNNFLAEARILAKFQQHPGIVSVLSFFPAFGTGYMVMEYVEGQTLKSYLQHYGRLAWTQTLDIFMQIMDALRAVHKAGLLHRDIAPDNIYICSDGRVKLLDFGAAQLDGIGSVQSAQSQTVIVKPGFAPEEQYRNTREQGPWSDVYSVAASMYYCLTGETPPDALERLKQDSLKLPSAYGVLIPPAAEQALLNALAVNSFQRPQSIETLQQQFLNLPANPAVGLDTRTNIHVNPQLKSKFAYPVASKNRYFFSGQRWLIIGSLSLMMLIFIFQLAKDKNPRIEPVPETKESGPSLQMSAPEPISNNDELVDRSRQRELERQASEELKQQQAAALKRFEERQRQESAPAQQGSKSLDATQKEHLRSLCDEWGATMDCKDFQ
ncbi:MAG: protein kinase [Methylomonas lenta]|nr:protein kinase [Methylomonas lenta]